MRVLSSNSVCAHTVEDVQRVCKQCVKADLGPQRAQDSSAFFDSNADVFGYSRSISESKRDPQAEPYRSPAIDSLLRKAGDLPAKIGIRRNVRNWQQLPGLLVDGDIEAS